MYFPMHLINRNLFSANNLTLPSPLIWILGRRRFPDYFPHLIWQEYLSKVQGTKNKKVPSSKWAIWVGFASKKIK